MKLDIHARTDVGLVRAQNEDAFSVWTPEPAPSDSFSEAVVAVADGMGGHPGGEIASAIAVEVASEVAAGGTPDSRRDLLREIFDRTTLRIGERGAADPRYREMGTTLTSTAVAEGVAHVAHIGDSRMYWIRGANCQQITRDHNVAQELVLSGRLEAEVAEDHPMANVLTRCLGVCPDHVPDVLEGVLQLEVDDVLLLASDGLAKAVHPQTLVELIRGVEAERATAQLVEAALSGGAPDNVTVLVIRVTATVEPPPAEGIHRFGDGVPLSWSRGG